MEQEVDPENAKKIDEFIDKLLNLKRLSSPFKLVSFYKICFYQNRIIIILAFCLLY